MWKQTLQTTWFPVLGALFSAPQLGHVAFIERCPLKVAQPLRLGNYWRDYVRSFALGAMLAVAPSHGQDRDYPLMSSDEEITTTSIATVIGTAGHVDHGKTTLVAHLTGMDTDRLIEEKQRGISIELGFAWLDVDGQRLALIDVPGHERFVRQMIAGAAGIDIVLLVVAADEGVMPQTLEHLDICQLLGVKVGAIVMTKVDLVDEEWLELAREDVSEAVEGTFLEGAPIWPYSAGDTKARDVIISALSDLVQTHRAEGQFVRSQDRPFKLSVDRAFTMKGFGTVVTGTSASGLLKMGTSVTLQPHGATGRVRGIQVHEVAVDSVGPGRRVAINVQGVEHDQVKRGDILVQSDRPLPVVSMVDARVRALARLADPIKDRAKVLVHLGTAQVQASLALVGQEFVEPGEEVSCQLRFERPVSILPGEPFIIRGFKVLERYGKTLGGGRVLAPQLRRHRRGNAEALQLIDGLSGGDPVAALVAWVTFQGEFGHDGVEAATLELPFDAAVLREAGVAAEKSGALHRGGARLFASSVVQYLTVLGRERLESFHAANPARYGMAVQALKTQLRAELDPALFELVLKQLAATQTTVQRGETLALVGFEPTLTAAQSNAVDKVASALSQGGLTPPRVQDLPEEVGLTTTAVREALDLLRQSERLVRVSNELCFDAAAIAALEGKIRTHLAANGEMETAAFKLMTGASRKWTIPLGEYFDRIRMTIRIGDVRRLRDD